MNKGIHILIISLIVVLTTVPFLASFLMEIFNDEMIAVLVCGTYGFYMSILISKIAEYIER
jgi:hypothetical protein